MTDFLLELRCEEIPARMQAKARADLEKLFNAQLSDAGLKAESVTVCSTPRRLALIARGLPEATEAVSEEAKGPPEGAPDQAVDGFCRKNGVTRDQLEVRDVKGRPTYFAIIDTPGRDTKNVLAEAIPAIIRAFPWPKSQRWGEASVSTESLKWVRPLSGIIALFGGDVVDCEIGGIASGRETTGHRFHSDAILQVDEADGYAETLRAAHVIVDHEERQNIIRDGAAKAAADAGLALIEDEGLVIENAGLTEWPVPLLGRFDESFLDVPPEVIQLTARVNQKYFVVNDKDGKLTNAFVCTANIDASDGGDAIVAGNEKVLAARLADAKFFWELDQKTTLEEHGKKLENIVFHEKLGTVADKVERVAKLAEWLVSLEGNGLIHADPEQTRLAARLCKTDLVTEMVGEFPELQGVMGGYYAEKEGLPIEVSNAIRDHYKPVGQGDDVPTDPVTVAVSLADKLDTVVGFFAISELPTGSKDPFALRRAVLAIIATVTKQELRFSLSGAFRQAMWEIGWQPYNRKRREDELFSKLLDKIWPEFPMHPGDGVIKKRGQQLHRDNPELQPYLKSELGAFTKQVSALMGNAVTATDKLYDFFADRLKVQQKEAGVRHDLIDAVFALGGEDDLVRLLARVKALQAFVTTDEGTNLLAGYKRAANILKQSGNDKTNVTPAQAGVHPEADAGAKGSSQPTGGIGTSLRWSDDVGLVGEDKALFDALNEAEPKATAAIEAEKFEDAMAALASLRAPIDAFFDGVMVNDPDEQKKAFRLGLLARFRDAVHRVADFSKIEG